jgi:lipoate-protein ligase A
VFKSLRENLTTLRRELDRVPPWETMIASLVQSFEVVLGPLVPVDLPMAVSEQVAKLAETHTTEEWLLRPGQRLRDGRRVRIGAGVEVAQRMHKAPGGLIRAIIETQHGQIVAVGLSGDFFFYPAEKLADLEQTLTSATLAEAQRTIEEFYRVHHIESPGVTPHDLAVALGVG